MVLGYRVALSSKLIPLEVKGPRNVSKGTHRLRWGHVAWWWSLCLTQ